MTRYTTDQNAHDAEPSQPAGTPADDSSDTPQVTGAVAGRASRRAAILAGLTIGAVAVSILAGDPTTVAGYH